MKQLKIMAVPLLVFCLLTSGCSVFMAASRTSYRGDINVVQLGVQRSTVIVELGPPDSFSTVENGGYDDRYSLTCRRLLHAVPVGVHRTALEIAAKDKISVYHLTYSPEGTLSSMEKI